MPIRHIAVMLVLVAVLGSGLVGCENTIRGAGKDIRETGDAVEDAVTGR